MPGCAVGDVDLREVVLIPTIIFCASMNFLRFLILFVILPSEHDGIMIVFFLLFFGQLLLSNDLFATELRRGVYLLSYSLVHGSEELS